MKVSLNAANSFLELINYRKNKKKSSYQEIVKFIFNESYPKDIHNNIDC